MLSGPTSSYTGLSVKRDRAELENHTIRDRIIEEVIGIPDGEKLLEDALQRGAIIIQIVQNPTDWDRKQNWISAGAAWDPSTRTILVLFRDLDRIILAKDIKAGTREAQKLFDFFDGVVFELCNAANPEFQSSSNPLLYSDRDIFARAVELKEFKTYQRLSKLRNFLNSKYQTFQAKEEKYTDDQFEDYMKLAEREDPTYGEVKSHAGTYRKIWDDTYIKFKKNVIETVLTELKDFHQNSLSDERIDELQKLREWFETNICPGLRDKIGIRQIFECLDQIFLEIDKH